LKLFGGFTRGSDCEFREFYCLSWIASVYVSHIESTPRPLYDGAATWRTDMSADSDLMAFDELPEDARALISRTERSIAEIRERADQQTTDIRDEADRDCTEIREQADAAVARIEQNSTRELAPLVRELVDSLRNMQERYAREGKLDEALAIRARVRQLRSDLLGVRPDPGNLTEFTTNDIGRTVMFEVVGRPDGSVWGTDTYTADSRLAVVAIHAGVLREGERGLVRVMFLDGEGVNYEGSAQHGIQTYDYANYPLAYRVERV
jgi:LCCL domain